MRITFIYLITGDRFYFNTAVEISNMHILSCVARFRLIYKICFTYSPPGGPQGPGPAPGPGPQGVVQLSQLIKLQGQPQGINGPRVSAPAGNFNKYKTF